MNRNCWTNSVPYGYGGRIAETSVLPVRIIMSPTCSSRFFVGRKTRSAADRTTAETPPPGSRRAPPRDTSRAGSLWHDPCRRQRQRCRAGASRRAPCGWYVRPALEGRRRYALGALAVAGLIAATGCGGGERQDADEPEGEFPVQVLNARFP